MAGIAAAMSFMVDPEGYVGLSAAPAASTAYVWTALALVFAWLFHSVFVKGGLKLHGLTIAFALLFGVCNAFGGYLYAYDTWRLSRLAFVLLLAKSVGQALPMAAGMTWLHHILQSGVLLGADKPIPRLAWFQKHPVLTVMGFCLVCWSPYLIAFFPGTVCWDLGEMAAQYFGALPMDTWHPVFLTWVLGGCIRLGRLFGSDNVGAALFTALQTLALAYAVACAVGYLRRLGIRKAVRIGVTAFFALCPLWAGYAQFISKDTLYTAVLLLFALAVLDLCTVGGKAIAFRLFLWGLLSCLIRPNGLYVVLPTAVLLVAFGAKGVQRLHIMAGLSCAVACALVFANVLVPSLGIRDESASGIYSVCFQQSARVLRDHRVTPAEFAQVDAVLEAARLPALYEPNISDPVKFTFRQYGQGKTAEKAALSRYRKAWADMFVKYPLTYAEAFFAGNISYYTFMAKIDGPSYNNQAGNRLVFETYELVDSRGHDPRFLDTTQIQSLSSVRRLLAAYARGWRHIPVLGFLYACATYTWLVVGAFVSAVRRRRGRLLIAFSPAVLTLAVCMLSPVNDYFRYFLPFAAMALPLVCAAAAKENAP